MDVTEDEKLIRDLLSEFNLSINNGDVDSIGRFLDLDVVRVGAFGEMQCGKQNLLDFYTATKELMKQAHLVLDTKRSRFLGDDYALVQQNVCMEIPKEPNQIKGHSVFILRKVSGNWLILEILAAHYRS